MKLNFLKTWKYKKEYQQVSEELVRKRNKLTNLFVEVNADRNRETGTDPQLDRLNKEVDRLIVRLVTLDKKINGNKSKYNY